MAYTPDPTDVAAPLNTEKASTAAAEFRAIKTYLRDAVAKIAGQVFTGDVTLEYAAPTLTVAGDTGVSSLLLGNKTAGGVAGPLVINSLDRTLTIGHGTAFDKATGGTVTQRLRIDSIGNVRVGQGATQYSFFEINAGSNDIAQETFTTGTYSLLAFNSATSTVNRPFLGGLGDKLVFGRVGVGEVGRIDNGVFLWGVAAAATDERMRIHSSGGAKLVLSDSSNICYITSAVVGPNSRMAFGTNGAERMRLSETGLDLSSGIFSGNGSGLTNVAAVTATTAGSAINANYATSAGSATSAGTAGSVTYSLTAGAGLTAGGTFNGSAAVTFAVDSATAATANKIVARDSVGDIYGRGFIANNADVASSNVLDWYLEGTFTPSLVGAGAPSYSTRSGKFTRVGNRVDFEIRLAWTGATPVGTFQVSGLPYSAAAVGASNIRFGWNGTAVSRNIGTSFLGLDFSGTTVSLVKSADSASESSLITTAAADSVVISGTYFV